MTVIDEPRIPGAAPSSTGKGAPDEHSSSARSFVERGVRLLWPPLAVYAVTALAQLIILSWMIPPGGPSVRDRLLQWDAHWYVDVAAHGYPDGFTYTPEGDLTGNTLAFFPLYPGLVRIVHYLTGTGYETAGLIAGHLATAAALCVLYVFMKRLYDRRAALAMTVLVGGAQPMGVVFSMAYSETLFLGLAVGTLLAAHRKAWLCAGVLACLTSLTRPAGIAVIAALGVAALLEMWRHRRVLLEPVVACVVACLGMPLYLLWVGTRVGEIDAWFTIQDAGWGTKWDNGEAVWHFLTDTLRNGDQWIAVSTAVLIIAAVVGSLVALNRRIWPPLAVYGLSILVMTLCQSNYYHSKLRLMIPTLLFFVPLALVLSRVRTRTAVLVLGGMCAFGMWYGAYMLTTWHYGI
ncbi:hypothetical protein [Embleya sp. NBC_00896]|uniref:hypothetical protein n=1 Tax=Embleya sp. NBC_00896 TaxID=2975961 RepID=UPI00386D6CD3|nr:glycosyltransferase family 39 protein [Embleya sp. NBC_00896]